jgi:DNA-binding beta-propeller fold protein YncE
MAVQEAEMGVAGGVPREQRPMPFAGGARHTAGPVTIYVANKAGNTVTPIRVGPGPELIAISPDGQTAYVVGVGSLLPEEAAAPVTLTASAIQTPSEKDRRSL